MAARNHSLAGLPASTAVTVSLHVATVAVQLRHAGQGSADNPRPCTAALLALVLGLGCSRRPMPPSLAQRPAASGARGPSIADGGLGRRLLRLRTVMSLRCASDALDRHRLREALQAQRCGPHPEALADGSPGGGSGPATIEAPYMLLSLLYEYGLAFSGRPAAGPSPLRSASARRPRRGCWWHETQEIVGDSDGDF